MPTYGPRTGLASGEVFTYSGAAGTLRLNWLGDGLGHVLPQMAADAINEVMALCVGNAMMLVLVDTGLLKNSIQIQQPAVAAVVIVGIWGSYAAYAIYQEIGPVTGVRYWTHRPYLRPSADRCYPQLAERIAAKLRAA